MHRALDNIDIITEIFEQLPCVEALSALELIDGTLDVLANRCTLARAARICRAFSDPALKVLWRHLDHLWPLFELFPSLHRPDVAKMFEYDLGDIGDHDLVRFKQYARRVRKIWPYWTPRRLNPSVYFNIATRLNGEPLLPYLQSLHYYQDSPYDTSMTTLLCPSLRSFHLNLRMMPVIPPPYNLNLGPHLALEKLFRTVCQRSPFLKQITLDNLYCSPTTFPFATLQHLQKIELGGCSVLSTSHALQAFSSLPGLLDLSVRMVEDGEKISVDCHSFQDLQKLEIWGTLPRVTEIVSAIASTALNSLMIDVLSTDSAQEYASLLATVASRWSTSLQTLLIALKPGDVRDATGQLIDISLMDIYHPALALKMLTSLSLDFYGKNSLEVTAEDLSALAGAHPHLKTLCITIARLNARPTLAAVLDLARRLPELNELAVPFTLNSADLRALAGSGVRVASCGLRLLDVGQDELEVAKDELALVAACINRAFPGLDVFTCEYRDYEKAWIQVRQELVALWELRQKSGGDGGGLLDCYMMW